jgi:hypothetical protein
MKLLKEELFNISLIALVVANMLPIYGVFAFGWDAFSIVLLYWAENLIIGFYNILKMTVAFITNPLRNLGKIFLIPFFVIHYGGFVAVHGMFIFLLFGKDRGGSMFPAGHAWPCFLVFVQLLIGIIERCWTTIPKDMKFVFVSLFLSHGVSFVRNYLIAGEYKTSAQKDLMAQPYYRVVIMHIAILAGGIFTGMIGSPVGVLIVLIVLKTIIDVKFHLRQHRAVVSVH